MSSGTGTGPEALRGDMNQEQKRALLIIIDSFPSNLMLDMLDKGELPNIKHFLIKRGTFIPFATTSFPSVSFSTHATILTGTLCMNHNIPGVRWFSREEKINRTYASPTWHYLNKDLNSRTATIFERLSVPSSCIWELISRGATRVFPMSHFFRPSSTPLAIDEISQGRRFVCIWFPALDMLGHIFGSSSQIIRWVARRIDRQLGQVFRFLTDKGLLASTMICLTSDHGQRKTSRHFDLISHLRRAGFSVAGRSYQRFTPKVFFRSQIVVCTEGNGSAHIYLRDVSLKPRVVSALLDQPAIRNIFVREHSSVRILDHLGNESRIRLNGDINGQLGKWKLSYHLYGTDDPLGLVPEFVPRCMIGKEIFHSTDKWLSMTANSQSPDIPVQISQLLLTDRAGQIVVTSNRGWDLKLWWHRGTHGGSLPEEMNIPLVIAGPGYPHTRLGVARTIDIVPSLLQFMNGNCPADIDGRPLLERIERKDDFHRSNQ